MALRPGYGIFARREPFRAYAHLAAIPVLVSAICEGVTVIPRALNPAPGAELQARAVGCLLILGLGGVIGWRMAIRWRGTACDDFLAGATFRLGSGLFSIPVGAVLAWLEPFFNRGLEEELGRLGVEVHRWLYIGDLTQWDILAGLSVPPLTKRGTGLTPNPHGEAAREAARAFVGRDIGGFGRMTVGHAVLFARAGFDGLVHLAPFESVPEVMAHNVLRRLQDEIPILSLTFDEQTARGRPGDSPGGVCGPAARAGGTGAKPDMRHCVPALKMV